MLSGKKILVAFSGGVDSSTLAAISKESAKETLLVMQIGDSVATGEKELASRIASDLNLDLKYLNYNEFEESQSYAQNPENRCYYCKWLLHDKLENLRRQLGFDYVVNGTNFSDLNGHRPGYQALLEFNVLSPFVDVQMTKPEIRHIAKDLGLVVWDKPATPCLASRVKTGIPISSDSLRKIDRAEQFLRNHFSFQTVRVRLLENDNASIEVEKNQIPLLHENFGLISAQLKKIGFTKIQIDPMGYRPYDPSLR